MAIRRRAVLGAIGATAAAALFAGRALLSPSPPRGKKIGRYIPGESLSEQEAEIVLATIDHVLLNDVDRPVLVWPLLGGWEPPYIVPSDVLQTIPELRLCGLSGLDIAFTWQNDRPRVKPIWDLPLPENCGWIANKGEDHFDGLANLVIASPLFLDDGRVLTGYRRSYAPLFGGQSAVLFERSAKGWLAIDSEITGIA